MKFIRKGAEPDALLEWKQANAAVPQNLRYGNLPASVKSKMVEALFREQGGLCAYTMKRLGDARDCHIEHVLPQHPHEDKALDFKNMVACFPANGGDKSHGYGAALKEDYDPRQRAFVSPLDSACELQSRFDLDGKVKHQSEAAKATIKLLDLCNRRLEQDRAAAIRGFRLSRKAKKPASAARRPYSALGRILWKRRGLRTYEVRLSTRRANMRWSA